MFFKPDQILRYFHNWGRTTISLLRIALMFPSNFSIEVYIKLNANRSGYRIFIARSFDSIARVQESLLLSLFSSKYLLTASHPYYVITFATHSPHISPGQIYVFHSKSICHEQNNHTHHIDNHFSKGKQNDCVYSVSRWANCKLIALFILTVHFTLPLG